MNKKIEDPDGVTHERLGHYWEWKPVNGEVRLKTDVTRFARLWFRFVSPFAVKDFYIWSRREWDSVAGMAVSDWLGHDNLRIDPSIEGEVSRIYQMQNGWRIREQDLVYLHGAAVLDEQGTSILVRADGWWVRLNQWVERHTPVPMFVLGIISVVVGIIALM